MKHKLAFKRNPRFDMAPDTPKATAADSLLSRPPFGVGARAREVAAVPKSRAALTARPHTSFVCEPSQVLITEWQPGVAVDVTLQVRRKPRTLECCWRAHLLSGCLHQVQKDSL
jgi:hypothetical protein